MSSRASKNRGPKVTYVWTEMEYAKARLRDTMRCAVAELEERARDQRIRDRGYEPMRVGA